MMKSALVHKLGRRSAGRILGAPPRAVGSVGSSQRRNDAAACRRFLSAWGKRQKTALVLGSSGALGSAVARHLSQSLNMKVLGADIVEELPTELSNSWELDGFISLPENAELPQFSAKLVQGVHEYLQGESEDPENSGLDVIVVASGGWEGDPPQAPPRKKKDIPLLPDEELASLESSAKAYAESVVRMRRMNLDPAIAASFVAQHMSTNDNGLMVVMGASAALSPTPGMMGYGLAKSATHHLVQIMGLLTAESNPLERQVLIKEAEAVPQPHPYMTVVGILPITIDTPHNRRAMPNGKFHLWTKPIDIAKEIGKWAENPVLRPHSGSLVRVFHHPADELPTFELVY